MTTVPRTLLDIAASSPMPRVRRALAEAEFLRLATIAEIASAAGMGRPGSAKLRQALDAHLPQLALTRSELEAGFLELIERHGVPVPAVNATVEGLLVDALWVQPRLIVELDGHAAHATPAGLERDRRRDLKLRAAGYRVLRYTWHQVMRDGDRVIADLDRALTESRVP